MAKQVNEVIVVTGGELPELTAVPANGQLLMIDPTDNRIKRASPSVVNGGTRTTLGWSVTGIYDEGVIVESQLKLWKSKVDGNEGNPPVEGAYWEEVSRSQSGNYWAAGVYDSDPTTVFYDKKEYLLDNTVVTFPFNSVNFATELSAGAWKLLGGDGTGGGLTPEQEADLAAAAEHIDGANEEKHTVAQIVPASGNAGKLMIVDPITGTSISYSDFLVSQILQLSAIDVSDPTWAEQAERLLLVKKVSGEPSFQGAAELIDLILPPATITTLSNDAGWVGESRTLTGANFLGEIAKLSQIGMGTDGTLFLCTSSGQGTQGGTNGSASFRRNRSVDALDMAIANDVNIANLLDPTRVGGNADTNWDTVNNVLVITTLTCKVGSWYTQGTGYHFFCYARSGTSYYWRRIGQPQSIQRPINATTHPNICAALLAHDFSTGAYTQSGLETTYQDQTFYDVATRKYFIKVTSTVWERIN